MLIKYILLLGIFLVFFGILELFIPLKIFSIWKKWISNRFFFLHGLLLISAGIPLIMYKGSLSAFIFFIGAFIMLTGPFMLIYPEKIREIYLSFSQELTVDGIKKIIYLDAFLRIIIGLTFIASTIL